MADPKNSDSSPIDQALAENSIELDHLMKLLALVGPAPGEAEKEKYLAHNLRGLLSRIIGVFYLGADILDDLIDFVALECGEIAMGSAQAILGPLELLFADGRTAVKSAGEALDDYRAGALSDEILTTFDPLAIAEDITGNLIRSGLVSAPRFKISYAEGLEASGPPLWAGLILSEALLYCDRLTPDCSTIIISFADLANDDTAIIFNCPGGGINKERLSRDGDCLRHMAEKIGARVMVTDSDGAASVTILFAGYGEEKELTETSKK